jgi:hypothetical protein
MQGLFNPNKDRRRRDKRKRLGELKIKKRLKMLKRNANVLRKRNWYHRAFPFGKSKFFLNSLDPKKKMIDKERKVFLRNEL